MEFKLNDMTDRELRWIFDHSGKIGPGREDVVRIKDALSVPHAPMMFPKVVSNIVKEAAEPLLIGTSLLQRVDWQFGQTVTIGGLGALVAGDVAEGGEYREQSPQVTTGTVTASIGKSGLAFKVTEEMIMWNQWDIVGILLRKAGQALARHKEEKIFNFIRSLGMVAFDNLNPTSSMFGVCTGRDIQGIANGSCTMDDVFDAYAQVITQGFMPNTILMHPLAWTMWVKDAQLRAFVQANGGGGTFFATTTGNAGAQFWGNSSQNGLGMSPGQNIVPGETSNGTTSPSGLAATPLLSYPQTITSAPQLPSYLGVPFRIIVSPFVYYDPRRKLTDIYLFDSSELGVLFVAEDIVTEEWPDPARELRKIKLRERYGIGMLNEGQAIAKIANVHVVPNEVVLPAQTTIDISGSNFAKISPTTSLTL